MRLYLDIETIGTEDPAIIAEIAETITPPGNYSKAETIAAWEKDIKPKLVDDAVRKTSFDGAYGKVICVGAAFDDAPPNAFVGEELELFTALGDVLRELKTLETIVIGHNVSWDVRFLWQRYVVNGLKPPNVIAKAARSKPWEIEDTMLLWNPDRDRRISLDKLCRALRVPTSKSDLDGSKIWDAYKVGEIERIAKYCCADVEATRACYLRIAL